MSGTVVLTDDSLSFGAVETVITNLDPELVGTALLYRLIKLVIRLVNSDLDGVHWNPVDASLIALSAGLDVPPLEHVQALITDACERYTRAS